MDAPPRSASTAHQYGVAESGCDAVHGTDGADAEAALGTTRIRFGDPPQLRGCFSATQPDLIACLQLHDDAGYGVVEMDCLAVWHPANNAHSPNHGVPIDRHATIRD